MIYIPWNSVTGNWSRCCHESNHGDELNIVMRPFAMVVFVGGDLVCVCVNILFATFGFWFYLIVMDFV